MPQPVNTIAPLTPTRWEIFYNFALVGSGKRACYLHRRVSGSASREDVQ